MEGVLNKIVFEHHCGLRLPALDLGINMQVDVVSGMNQMDSRALVG